MIRKSQKFCWNVFEHVGTDLKGVVRSNNVGTAVLPKKWISKQIGGVSGLVCPVGTVGQENSVLDFFRHKIQGIRFKTREVGDAD